MQWRGAGSSEKLVIQHLHLAWPPHIKLANWPRRNVKVGKLKYLCSGKYKNIRAKNPIKNSNFGGERKIVAGIAGTSRVRGRKVDGFQFYLLSDIPHDISD